MTLVETRCHSFLLVIYVAYSDNFAQLHGGRPLAIVNTVRVQNIVLAHSFCSMESMTNVAPKLLDRCNLIINYLPQDMDDNGVRVIRLL